MSSLTRTKLQALLRGLLRCWADESGSTPLLVLGLIVGAIMLVPLFFDIASVHYSRRTGQTSSDAAVMAAAKEYAVRLSVMPPATWEGVCTEPEVAVVGRYLAFVQGIQWNRNIGLPWAHQFAEANRATLYAYQNWPSPRFKVVSGVSIPYLYVSVETQKPVYLTLQARYGEDYKTSASAYAEVYLDRSNHWTIPCGPDGELIHLYQFYWRIALVDEP